MALRCLPRVPTMVDEDFAGVGGVGLGIPPMRGSWGVGWEGVGHCVIPFFFDVRPWPIILEWGRPMYPVWGRPVFFLGTFGVQTYMTFQQRVRGDSGDGKDIASKYVRRP